MWEQLELKLILLECGEVFRSYSGYMYHPSYPRPYKNNINCLWTVQAPEKYRVRLEFKFFKVEYAFGCQNDYVAIYNGPDDNSPLISRSCGHDLPDSIESTGNTISVVMKTNDQVTDQGAVILYKRIEEGQLISTTPGADKSTTLILVMYTAKVLLNLECPLCRELSAFS